MSQVILVRASLPATPLAPRQAREKIRAALHACGLAALADDAVLLASELVANAVQHARGSRVGLVVREDGGTVTCEVSDASPAMPRRRRRGEERGRGLAIVAAVAADWGVRTRLRGKTCWFTLAGRPS